MLADVDSDLLTLMVVGVHQDPLNQVITVLVAGDVDEWDSRTIWMCRRNDAEVALQELDATDLQALLDHFRSELVDAVAVCVAKNMVNDSPLVGR